MLVDPRGYRILELIHESSTTLVFRAERERDRRAVVLKILKRDAATPSALATYRHEREVLERLPIAGVIALLGVEMVQGVPMLVLEDFGAESLARLHRKQRLPRERLLALAIRIADILADLHDHGVVHCDINPANILLDPVNDVLKITDFGASQTAGREQRAADGRLSGWRRNR